MFPESSLQRLAQLVPELEQKLGRIISYSSDFFNHEARILLGSLARDSTGRLLRSGSGLQQVRVLIQAPEEEEGNFLVFLETFQGVNMDKFGLAMMAEAETAEDILKLTQRWYQQLLDRQMLLFR